jgi:Tfp pilus assembly protein PilW
MKLPILHPAARSQAGLTLVETLMVAGLFGALVLGLVTSQVTGLQLFSSTAARLTASHSTRGALNFVRDEIRAAKTVEVGTGNRTSFVRAPQNLQQGNAIQIYPTASTNQFLRLFVDSEGCTLSRVSSDNPSPVVIATSVTNQVVFFAEDFKGQLLTNNQDNRVIRMLLEFSQWEFPSKGFGSGSKYDYFRLQTRITRRAIE